MPNLDPIESSAVLAATATMSGLLQLDEIWTNAAISGPASSNGLSRNVWLAQLESVVNLMAELLWSMPEHRVRLTELLERHSDSAEETLRALQWGDLLGSDDRADLRWWVDQRSLSGMWGGAGYLFSPEVVAAEADGLRTQWSRLSEGVTVGGDLSKEFRCGAANGLLTGGVLLIPTGVAAGVAALSVGAVAAAAGVATGGVGFLIAGTALWWARRHRC
jgi:hypothetical protein